MEEYIEIGNMNGRIGNDHEKMGRYVEHTKNSSGRRIKDFCTMSLLIAIPSSNRAIRINLLGR